VSERLPVCQGTLADRAHRARGHTIVGRQEEIGRFRDAIGALPGAYSVLFLHGPGGVGKSTLLDRFADIAVDAGRLVGRIDLRTIDPTPAAFLAALADRVGVDPLAEPATIIAGLVSTSRLAVLIDAAEHGAPLDGWLRASFVPQLASDAVVVVAGRDAPAIDWRTDPGWRHLATAVELANLPADDVRAFLTLRGIDPALHDQMAKVTYGHPLALSLLTDQVDRDGRLTDLVDDPHLVRHLLERFVAEVPTPAHRDALLVAALARFTTEDLLRVALPGEDSPALFDWLRDLPIIEASSEGLGAHDLARDVIAAELRGRDPYRCDELHDAVFGHLVERVQATTGARQTRAVTDLMYLHRAVPVVRNYWDWIEFGSAYADDVRADDHDALVAMTRRHEGAAAAAVVRHWLGRAAARFVVVRDGSDEPLGFGCVLALHETDDADLAADPGAVAVAAWIARHEPPRPDEQVFAVRCFVDREVHQGVSASFNVLSTAAIQDTLSRPRQAWRFLACFTDSNAVEGLLRLADYDPVHDAAFVVGGTRYAVFAHDFRRTGPYEWLDCMGRTLDGPLALAPDAPAETVVLAEAEFAAEVGRALRHLHQPESLAQNRLLQARVVRDRISPATAGSSAASPVVLVALIEDAAAAMATDRRAVQFHRAIDRTYLRPAPTQQRAAEVLDLPFSTYRRHLGRGQDWITAWLWHRELHGPGTGPRAAGA